MKDSDFSTNVVLDTLKGALSSRSNSDLVEVSLDSELVALDGISESDLLGSAKSVYEEELNKKVLENEKHVAKRFERLKTYGDDIF